ncbi:MAG: hypothetical protein ACTS22_02500 [Phycisphaerales bacterium]
MLKFLRKYNKLILVIGGSLLMVAFLAPQAIQQLGQIRNRPVGTYDGRTIKEKEFQLASQELRALNALGNAGGVATVLLRLANESSSEAELHWYLLSKEAEQGGFVGSDLDGRSYYPVLAQQIAIAVISENPQFQGLPPQFLQQIAAEQAQQWLERLERSEASAAGAGRFTSLDELHRAVAKMRGVQRMRTAYNNAAKSSAARVKSAGSEIFRAAEIDHVVVPAERYLDSVAEPTEDDIRAHFEAYADVNAAANEFGIGYLQPRRVKLEWITLSRSDLEQAVEIPRLDISRHWQTNRDRFPGEISDEREAVRSELLRERIDALLAAADRYVRAAIIPQTRTLQPDGDYFDLPDGWAETRPPLEAVAEAMVERFRESEGIEIPTPKVHRRTEAWQTPRDLSEIEGFQFSRVRAGSVQLPGVAVPFQVRELATPDSPVDPNIPIQVGLLAAQFPLVQSDGTRHYFRVTDARGVSAPETLNEVREQVVTDLRRLRAFETLQSELESYAQVARAGGLEAVVDAMNAGIPEDDAARRVTLGEGLRLGTRPQAGTPRAFLDPEVLDQLFAATERLDPTVDLETVPLDERVFTAVSNRTLSGVVGVVDQLIPLTTEDFRLAYQQIAGAVVQQELQELGATDDPFSFERLQDRHKWRFIGGGDEDARDAETQPSPPAGQDDADAADES